MITNKEVAMEISRKAKELIAWGRENFDPMADQTDAWIYTNYYSRCGLTGLQHRGPPGMMCKAIYVLAIKATPTTAIICSKRAHNRIFPQVEHLLEVNGNVDRAYVERVQYTQHFYPQIFLTNYVHEWISHFVGITIANSYQLRNGTTTQIAAKHMQNWIDIAWQFLPASYQMS